MNSVGPEATTAQLVGAVPLEKNNENALPGGFPETPADELSQEVSVKPLPAAEGAINPIKLAPGEPVPESVSAQGVDTHVKLDKASYEKADELPGVPSLDSMPPVSKNMIPESSLPILTGGQNFFVNSVGANSTTAELVGQLPLEPQVPEVVRESQAKAKVDPEASAISEEVKEKAEVEEELKKKVPVAPSTSEGTAGKGTEKSESDKTVAATVAGAATAVGATALAISEAAKDTAADAAAKLPEPVKQAVPGPIRNAAGSKDKEAKLETVSPEVPAEVKESIAKAHESPEAAANTVAVEDKKEMEVELLKQVKPTEPVAPSTPAKDAPATPAKANGAEAAAVKKEPETTAPDTPASSALPSVAGTPSSDKKKNRVSSFFGKIKSKMGTSSKDGSKDKA